MPPAIREKLNSTTLASWAQTLTFVGGIAALIYTAGGKNQSLEDLRGITKDLSVAVSQLATNSSSHTTAITAQGEMLKDIQTRLGSLEHRTPR